MKNKKIVLIDGSSCVHRAYHALPPLTGPEGIPVNAAYGFLKMLNKIIKNQQPGYMLVAFDHKKPTFRHERYPDYKAQRKKTDRELLQQFPLIFEILDLLKIKRISFEGFEADDIIATLAKKARKKNMPVSIVTGDKDIMQVVKKGVLITDGMKNKIYDERAIKEKLGVEPRFVTDYLALIGDKSDNLPGVRGIGPVSAARLINRYGGLDSIYASLDKIDERYRKKLVKHKESAYLTFNMVKLVGDIDLPVKIEDCRRRGPDKEKLKEKFEYLNFNSIVSDWIKKDELKDEIKTRTLSEYGKVRSFVLKHASCKQVFIYPFFESEVLRGVGISYSGKECVYLPSGRSLLNPGGGLEKKEINKIFKDYILKNSALATYDFKSLYKYFKKQGAGKARPAFDCISAEYVVSGESGKRS
ncbi:MAG: 5'-3' exonuclease, partial [Elusimicrobiota bacterium]